MKRITIYYWIVTGLFALFMISTAIPNIMLNEDSIKFISDGLGYPVYFVAFIGWAKVFGVITILIPGLDRLKEWAYAGLFFDLTGATYSVLATSGFAFSIFGMLPPFLFLFGSYYLNRRKVELSKAQ